MKQIMRAAVAGTALGWAFPALAADFPANFVVNGMDSARGAQIIGMPGGGAPGGARITYLGDVNGDSIGDLAVGVPGAGADANGKVYVVYGKAGGFGAGFDVGLLDGTNGFVIIGKAGQALGTSVAGAGDFDHDGLKDIVVTGTSPSTAATGPLAAETYVIYGKAGSRPSSVSVDFLSATDGLTIVGEYAGRHDGITVASAGDFDGDGASDILIGDPNATVFGLDAIGMAYLVYGGSQRRTAPLHLSEVDGVNGSRIYRVISRTLGGGAISQVNMATALTAAGDLNNDGFGDIVVVGQAVPTFMSPPRPIAHVYFGCHCRLAANAALSSTGFTFTGSVVPDSMGFQVAGGGDVNGDGVADIAIASLSANATYLIFGHAAPFDQSLTPASLANGAGGTVVAGNLAGTLMGSIAMNGDLNGDGKSDVVLGSPGFNAGAGAGFAIYGKEAWSAPLALSDLDGTNGTRADSGKPLSQFGYSVAMGDVSGDGRADALAVAPTWDNAVSGFVFYGQAPSTPEPIYGTDANDSLIGTAKPDLMAGRLGNDIIEGGPSGDTMYGDAGYDTLSYAHAAGPVTVDFQNYALNTGEAKDDYFEGFEALMGSPFADTLRADDNPNTLTGLGGADLLWGRGGRDSFRYLSTSDSPRGAGRDVIADFNPGTAATVVDRIDLSAIDANSCTCMPQNEAFKFIATAAFSGRPGQLRLAPNSSGVIVQGDVNGDRVPDLEIKLSGVTTLTAITAADFKL